MLFFYNVWDGGAAGNFRLGGPNYAMHVSPRLEHEITAVGGRGEGGYPLYQNFLNGFVKISQGCRGWGSEPLDPLAGYASGSWTNGGDEEELFENQPQY